MSADPVVSVSEPRELFFGNFAFIPGSPTNYDITPDGERFLMVIEEEVTIPPAEIRVVLNWRDEVEETMAAAGQ